MKSWQNATTPPQLRGLNVSEEQASPDWIRELVIQRADNLDLTAYGVWKRAAQYGKISETQVRRFLNREASMGSELLQHVLAGLGLEIVISKPEKVAN